MFDINALVRIVNPGGGELENLAGKLLADGGELMVRYSEQFKGCGGFGRVGTRERHLLRRSAVRQTVTAIFSSTEKTAAWRQSSFRKSAEDLNLFSRVRV